MIRMNSMWLRGIEDGLEDVLLVVEAEILGIAAVGGLVHECAPLLVNHPGLS